MSCRVFPSVSWWSWRTFVSRITSGWTNRWLNIRVVYSVIPWFSNTPTPSGVYESSTGMNRQNVLMFSYRVTRGPRRSMGM